MGGYGSSRWGGYPTRATTTSALTLEVAPLKALWANAEGVRGAVSWPRKEGPSPEMGFTLSSVERADDGQHFHRTLTLACQVNTRADSGPGEKVSLSVHLTACPMPLGGRRWWFSCPTCGHRRASLYLVRPLGTWRFLCRACARLAYPSQHEAPEDRAFRRVRKLSRRLGVPVEAPADSPDLLAVGLRRPKGMRRATYRRLKPQWERALVTHSDLMTQTLDRLLGRFNARHLRQGAR